jgi:hypothetical protein
LFQVVNQAAVFDKFSIDAARKTFNPSGHFDPLVVSDIEQGFFPCDRNDRGCAAFEGSCRYKGVFYAPSTGAQ